MSPWGRTIAQLSPLTYMTDLMRYSIQGGSYYPILLDFAAIAIFTVIFMALAMFFHIRNMP
jgi:ABC-2 type transport system permease protein